jgi:hypothetical protein
LFKKHVSYVNSNVLTNGTVSLDLNLTTNYTVQNPDPLLTDYFKKLFSSNLNSLQNRIVTGFTNSTINFYQNQANNQTLNFPLELSNKNSYNIDLSFNENPLYDISRGIVFYHNGEVLKNSGNKGFLKETIHRKWDKFNPDQGNFQIFLSSFIIEQIVNDVSENQSFNFKIENKNLPLNSLFRLQIEYLGHIIPKVYEEFAKDAEIFVTLRANQMKFRMNEKNMVGELNLEYNIKNNDKLLLAFNILSDFTLLPLYQNQKFNLVLKALEIKDTTVVNNAYGELDEEMLRTYSFESLNSYLQTNPFYLFKQDIDFSRLFESSKVMMVENEGIVIAGHGNNFYSSKVTKNVEEMIISMLKNYLN